MHAEMDVVAVSTSFATSSKDPAAVKAYFASLTERQQQGYRVAEAHLKTTFDVEKTHGFLAWLERQRR